MIKISKRLKSVYMKSICVAGMFLISLNIFSQTAIPAYSLKVSFNKTTNLIFDCSIIKVDMGSRDIIGQIVQLADTILQVKAAKKDFPETNMTVITADGKLHCFNVNYSSEPEEMNISFPKDSVNDSRPDLTNPYWLNTQARQIEEQKLFLHIATRAEEMKLSLKSIYIKGGILWFNFLLRNQSLIDYHPDYIHFYIKDKRRPKRTAVQESTITPVYMLPIGAIGGGGKKNWTVAFNQFTLPNDKRLVCEISEQSGGRLLVLPIGHRALLKARIPSR